MDRKKLVVAALAAAGEDAQFTPVQLQKLFFLIDREAPHLFGGEHFSFRAYDYGPFDRAVYDEVELLSARGLANVESSGSFRRYRLTPEGSQLGQSALSELPESSRTYLEQISAWVRSLSFQQLVAAIYRRHPDMKANSVFRE